MVPPYPIYSNWKEVTEDLANTQPILNGLYKERNNRHTRDTLSASREDILLALIQQDKAMQAPLDDTVTEQISALPELIVQPPVISPTVYDEQKDNWNQEATDLDGISKGNTDGNSECLQIQDDFLVRVLSKYSQSSRLCLELAVGGPL